MPSVKAGESQQAFVSRCIPVVLHEGTAKDNKQAAAVCNSMYRQRKPGAAKQFDKKKV